MTLPDATTDERALREVVRRLEMTWNTGDSTAYAALFTEDAQFVDSAGLHLSGRVAISQASRHALTQTLAGSNRLSSIDTVRLLGPASAFIIGQFRLRYLKDDALVEQASRFALVLTRTNADAQWGVALLHCTPIVTAHRLTTASAS
jgi:uncharacterized protein (TIGR02246 family)